MRFEDWLIREGYRFTKYLNNKWGWVRNNKIATTSVLDALKAEFEYELSYGVREI